MTSRTAAREHEEQHVDSLPLLEHGQFPPIGDLAFLSDREVGALLAPTGNIEWLCLPAPDSPSVFGALLDRGAGRFRVGPAGIVAAAATAAG